MPITLRRYRYQLVFVIAIAALFIAYKVTAQNAAVTAVDFDNGPLVAKNQPANVVLALSVEFPTSGGAYKDATYIDGKEYLGYFNSSRCYSYPGYGNIPRTGQFDANTDYFSPTGVTNTTYQCNVGGAGSGFSGNYLNYATMSAPDILRLALTGGDRGIDEVNRTVLDRGTTAANYRRVVSSAVTARVSPFNINQALYAFNCSDRVIFTTNSGKGCENPNLGDASDLSPIVASSVVASGTTTVTPTIPPMQQIGTTWSNTGNLTTTIPTFGPIVSVTFYTTTQALTTNAFICPAAPCVTEAGPTVDTGIKATSYSVLGTSTIAAPAAWPTSGGLPNRTIQGYYWTGGTSTTAPPTAQESPAEIRGYTANGSVTTTTAPIAAAESPAVIRGYFWNGTSTTTVAPVTAEESPAVIRGYVWTDSGDVSLDYQGGTAPANAPNTNESLPNSRYLCFSPGAPRIIRAYSASGSTSTTSAGSSTNITQKYCADKGWTQTIASNNNTRTVKTLYTRGAPFYRDYTPYYTAYLPYYRTYAPYYISYNRIDSYWAYTSYTKYQVLFEQAVWNNYSANAKAIVKPRALVCDSIEGPTRSVVYGTGTGDFYNYCTKYEFAGNSGYKPEGQIQQKSENLRVSVFSYLLDGAARYGGVMRAPMKYVGPNKYDDLGNLSVNPEREWKITTGQFEVKPITDATSTSFTNTGVINYLNKFGKTGNYKTFDPTGELWYESLRYLQGLSPTAEATSGMTAAMKDGYPVYETWTDPLTSACQRNNYILGIGDTNTHWDRTMPGITRAEQIAGNSESETNDFQYSAAPTIKGSGTGLNAHTWTQIMDGYERSGATARTYTDSKLRAQTTAAKNPSPSTGFSDLDTWGTGSGGRSSYHWTGLAYWANTQPIRTDIKGGASMDQVRVKTFMIDVDENNQGSVNASIKRTSYYLAGKYGYFDDSAQTGNPYLNTDGSQWSDASGSAKGYVLASQPQRLVAGIKKFFDDSTNGGNSFATVAVSSNSLSATSPSGQTFEPSFVPGQWGGTIKSVQLSLNTATNTLERGSVTWDAGEVLTSASREAGAVSLPKVKPEQRNIITYIAAGTPRGVTFTFAATSDGADLPATFNQIPYTASVDNQAEARVNYLRGDRTKEMDETFRPRQNILGDIINSGPFFKGGANLSISGADYPAFSAAHSNRTPVVYSGANDGMMHAFRADTGQELFAYIPSGVLTKIPNLTSKSYIHELFVDAVPTVDEVRTSSGWKTVLASGMGGGAQGVFALDVTDPTNFNTSKVMFEFTDLDDPAMGNVTSQPQFVKMLVANSVPASYKYYIVVSSGYNNYKNDGSGRHLTLPDQALFFLDINKGIETAWAEGTNYFKVILPASDPTKVNGLAQPGVRLGSANEGVEFFIGDMQGNMWKAAFPGGINSTKVTGAVRKNGSNVKTPLFSAKDAAANIQPITVAPVIYPYANGGNMVIFGTGRLLESVDRNTTSTQAVYGVWDSGNTDAASYNLVPAKLSALTLNPTTLVISGSTATFSASAGAKRGWYFNLTRSKERIVVSPFSITGVVQFSSTIPPTSECTDNGNSLVYFLNPANGLLLVDVAGDSGYFSRGYKVDLFPLESTSSYSARTVSGGRTASLRKGLVVPGAGGQSITKYFDVTYLRTGRVYWREVRDFNLVTQ